MIDLVEKLKHDFPDIKFEKGDNFYWSPKKQTVVYAGGSTQPEISTWTLLHELSHGILGHKNYASDFELMQLEVEAWQHAKKLAKNYDVKISPEHIQDCLDTYRDWLHRRATCPNCSTVSAQEDVKTYKCINCSTIWNVSASRFCRPYRKVSNG